MRIRNRLISIRQSVGLRGEVLFGLGLLDLAQAWTMWTDQTSAINEWFTSVLPAFTWGCMWATVGVICLVHAFRRDDHVGYVAAIGVKVIWVIGALAGWLTADVTLGGVVIWALVAWIVWRIGRLAEPVYVERSDTGDDQV